MGGTCTNCIHMQYRVPLSQPVSFAFLDFSYEKKIHIDGSQEDKGDKEVWHPEDEQQLAAPIHHHPVLSLELPHPFAEIVEVPTASGTIAEQELLLSSDSRPSSKVCKCLCGALNCIDNCQSMLTMNSYLYPHIYLLIFYFLMNREQRKNGPPDTGNC